MNVFLNVLVIIFMNNVTKNFSNFLIWNLHINVLSTFRMLSFSMFLLLSLNETDLVRKTGSDGSCPHSIHRDQFTCFAKGDLVAFFKVSPIIYRFVWIQFHGHIGWKSMGLVFFPKFLAGVHDIVNISWVHAQFLSLFFIITKFY